MKNHETGPCTMQFWWNHLATGDQGLTTAQIQNRKWLTVTSPQLTIVKEWKCCHGTVFFSLLVDQPDRPHHGRINQGATCYLNSVLQVLSITTEFHNRFETAAFIFTKEYNVTTILCTILTGNNILIQRVNSHYSLRNYCLPKGWTHDQTQINTWEKSLKTWRRKHAE